MPAGFLLLEFGNFNMKRNFQKIKLLLGVTCVTLSSSCATIEDKQYQICRTDDTCIETKDTYSVSHFGFDACEGNECSKEQRFSGSFDRATLEYNNNGVPFNFKEKQKKAILQYLNDKKNKHKKVFVVVYVHGWHHNADSNDESYKAFDNVLIRHVNQLARLGIKDYRVFGIYVGWQGERLDNDLFITIGDRAETANRIGDGNFSEDLKEIADARGDADKMLVMGHSFGGRILTKAYICPEYGTEHCPSKAPNLQPLGKNTLIVTINPAVDASAYRGVLSLPNSSAPQNTLPTWINITAEEDSATEFWYPLAKQVGLLEEPNVANNRFEGRTIGHHKDSQTHELKICTHIEKDLPITLPHDPYSNWYRVDAKGNKDFSLVYGSYPNKHNENKFDFSDSDYLMLRTNL